MFKNNKINSKINAELCDNLLESVDNSLKNSKNDSYKKGLYPFKIMKQLLIQLGSNVLLDKDKAPYIKKIKDCKFESVLNSIHFYVNTHNIDEIENLLCSEHILRDLRLKERSIVDKTCLFTGINKIDPSKFGDYYEKHSEYNKVIKNIYKQAQESDVSKKYLEDIRSYSTTDLNSFKIYVDGNLVYQPCNKHKFVLPDIIDHIPSGYIPSIPAPSMFPERIDTWDIEIISKDLVNIIRNFEP